MAKRKKKKVKYTAEEKVKREREKIARRVKREGFYNALRAPPFISKDFYKHSETGEVYAMVLYSGKIIASVGPLPENDLKDLDSYEYTTDRNDWLNENNDKMILM